MQQQSEESTPWRRLRRCRLRFLCANGLSMLATIMRFMKVELGGGPYALTAGPDSAVWVTCVHGGEIARVTVDGDVSRFDAGVRPSIITTGPDGALWFTRA